MKLVEKREELKAKQDALAKIFADAGADLDLSKVDALKSFTDSAAKAVEVKRLNDELTALGKEVEALVEIEGISASVKAMGDRMNTPAGAIQHPAKAGPQIEVAKSLGDLFVESAAFKEYKGGGQGPMGVADVDVKTLFETSAGWAPESLRTGKVAYSAQAPIRVVNLIPKTSTTQAAIVYMKETTFTNNAAEVAEGGTYGEGALVLTETSSTVRKIAVWIPITDEQLEDVGYARAYVTNRLGYMLDLRLDGQLLTGDGIAPNLTGILELTDIQSQAIGADSVPDAIYKAMTKVRVTGRAEPTAVVLHPNDWQGIRLLTTADGIYIWGSPAEAGPERIWGLGVVQSTNETENTGLVGDFANFSELALRRGVEFQITNSHSDYFIRGKQAVRADFRAAFLSYRDQAFCKVTGI